MTRGDALDFAMQVNQQKEKRDTRRCGELADDNIRFLTENILLKQENKRLHALNEALAKRVAELEKVEDFERIHAAVTLLCRR